MIVDTNKRDEDHLSVGEEPANSCRLIADRKSGVRFAAVGWWPSSWLPLFADLTDHPTTTHKQAWRALYMASGAHNNELSSCPSFVPARKDHQTLS